MTATPPPKEARAGDIQVGDVFDLRMTVTEIDNKSGARAFVYKLVAIDAGAEFGDWASIDLLTRSRRVERALQVGDRVKFPAPALNAIPPDVLSWVSAHPEAAKGLAEGTHVAVERTTKALITLAYNIGQDNIAASTPVTSDEAQGER